ncbi:MAG: IS3 family transposase [Bdellovibrionales bacterium]
MRRLDELYTAHPFLGYRKLTKLLQREGHGVNRKRVRQLMRLLGLQAI